MKGDEKMRHERIVITPGVMMGKPCIKGTRITVEQLLRELGEGLTPADLLEVHPHIRIEDVHAAVEYAADVMHQAWLLTQPALLGEDTDAISRR